MLDLETTQKFLDLKIYKLQFGVNNNYFHLIQLKKNELNFKLI